jgi:hypothetical protein
LRTSVATTRRLALQRTCLTQVIGHELALFRCLVLRASTGYTPHKHRRNTRIDCGSGLV